MTEAMAIYGLNNASWFFSNQVIDLFTNIKNQILEICTGSIFNIVNITSRIDDNFVKEQSIINFIVPTYELNRYKVKPFPVTIGIDNGEFLCNFAEARISVADETEIKAIETLKEFIVELYEIYKKEAILGPEPQYQLSVLEKYIV